MTRRFGVSHEIQFVIDLYDKQDGWGKFTLLVNDNTIIQDCEGALTFLCVDLEVWARNIDVYQDSYFWQVSDKQTLDRWMKYFSKKGLDSLESDDEEFCDLFFRAFIQLHSNFFDDYIFVGLCDHSLFRMKVWEKFNTHQVKDYSVSKQKMIETINEVVAFLDKELPRY